MYDFKICCRIQTEGDIAKHERKGVNDRTAKESSPGKVIIEC